MNLSEMKDILAQVMYIDSPEEIDPDASIFEDYEMNSIDLIDFTYEIKKKEDMDFPDGTLWPVNSFMNEADYYDSATLQWTDAGLDKINSLFTLDAPIADKSTKVNDLYKYFTLNYIQKRLEDIRNQ
ncbi:acyl carrier protein [Vibrio mangrovi]|uniref:Acyl carrier protein n=1 Tax=Vibrio mangrovi TaxID=474394 RepID=A0A1Y6IXL6_9VIBR|nr:acyl carrier protein [Vibrio mangrovi]MDW6002905.1 acyl carrier protein [Vibrio mangrovi]SMS02394.1 Acyl carrier protein [Vibrio mangrovi]